MTDWRKDVETVKDRLWGDDPEQLKEVESALDSLVAHIETVERNHKDDLVQLVQSKEWAHEQFARAEAAERRVEEAEQIIHSALVTGSDPKKALSDAMDALGGGSIPVAS